MRSFFLTLNARRIARDTRIELAEDTLWRAGHQPCWLFSFGAYGERQVLSFGLVDEALDAAAELLPPGYFTEPDYAACEDEHGDEAEDEAARAFDAEEDLTHTSAGWLPSWEWTVREVSLDDLRTLLAR